MISKICSSAANNKPSFGQADKFGYGDFTVSQNKKSLDILQEYTELLLLNERLAKKEFEQADDGFEICKFVALNGDIVSISHETRDMPAKITLKSLERKEAIVFTNIYMNENSMGAIIFDKLLERFQQLCKKSHVNLIKKVL